MYERAQCEKTAINPRPILKKRMETTSRRRYICPLYPPQVKKGEEQRQGHRKTKKGMGEGLGAVISPTAPIKTPQEGKVGEEEPEDTDEGDQTHSHQQHSGKMGPGRSRGSLYVEVTYDMIRKIRNRKGRRYQKTPSKKGMTSEWTNSMA